MALEYTFDKPSIPLDGGIYSFLEQFYRISDTPEEHDLYADQFTPDATIIMASKQGRGTAEIKKLRESMWVHVAARKHKVHKVFALSADHPEIMLYGNVAYDLKDGGKSSKEWGARGVLEKDKSDGRWRLSFYQVYLDTAN